MVQVRSWDGNQQRPDSPWQALRYARYGDRFHAFSSIWSRERGSRRDDHVAASREFMDVIYGMRERGGGFKKKRGRLYSLVIAFFSKIQQIYFRASILNRVYFIPLYFMTLPRTKPMLDKHLFSLLRSIGTSLPKRTKNTMHKPHK